MKYYNRNNNSKYLQGEFKPKNVEKYSGTIPILFRSEWELKFMQFLDLSTGCIKWSSESVVIKYISPIDSKEHRYFVDFYAEFKQKDGNIGKHLIEIKPKKFMSKPIMTKRKNPKTFQEEMQIYLVNRAKWDAAENYCRRNGIKFSVMCEEDIFKMAGNVQT